jgi:hypothetical protein
VQLTTAVRNARLAAIATAAGSGGTLKIYTGTSPGVSVTATGTLLSTLTAVVFGTPSAGAVAITATADPSNAASGTPGYARLATSGGTAIADFTAAVGSGEINFNAMIALGGTDTDTSFTITDGNS